MRSDDLPTVSEMYEEQVRASREAWRAPSTAPAPRVRHDASTQDATVRDGTRVDVASIPKIADLYEASVRRSLSAWKNTGDKPERGGAR